MSVSVVSTRRSNLGEGPHWDSSSGTLLHVDATAGDVCRLDVQTGETTAVHLDGLVTFVIPYTTSASLNVITVSRTLRKLDWTTGATESLLEVDADKPTNNFNDGKCDATGRLWGGTAGAQIEGSLDLNKGTLYSFDSVDLTVKSHKSGLNISNGMSWSPDGRTMFFIDSYSRKIYSFDFSPQDGALSNEQTFLDFSTNPVYKDCGDPDGMTVDIEGKLWVACWDGGRVLNIDPETGALIRQVRLPAVRTTSCCFGGPNYDELFVTSAWCGLTEEQRKAEPLSGSVFKITGLGVKGFPAHLFNR